MEENQTAESVEQAPAAVKEQEPKKSGAVRAFGLFAIIAAIALCVGYFLPYTSMTDETRASFEASASQEVLKGSGITNGDMFDASFVTWTRLYWQESESVSDALNIGAGSNSVLWIFAIMVASAALAVLALLFALARKATPIVLLSLLNVGVLSFLSAFFEEIAVGAKYTWAFGHTYMIVVLAMLMFAGVSLFCAKRKAKRSAK